MLKNLSIKTRLISVIAFVCILSVGVGVSGLLRLGETNSAVKTLYEDRMVSLGQLGTVLSLTQQNQLTIATALTGDPKGLASAVEQVKAVTVKINAEWSAYMATFLTAEEKALAERFKESRAKLVEGRAPILAAMGAGDGPAATALLQGPVVALYKTFQDDMAALIQLQLDVGKDEYTKSQARYETSRLTAIITVALGSLVGIVMGAWLITGITRSLAKALHLAQRVAEGDLTVKVSNTSNDEVGKLLTAMGAMTEKLVGIVGQVRTGTETIATGSSQIASGNLDLSSRTEQQAASLEETASSMEELTSTVKQNADNARQANQLAVTASGVAVKGGAVVSQVVDTMGSINDSAKKIVDIIAVIDGIAFQTNILALNAAVEAARAGEQGRGFAVVATEVRSLAQRSAAAAKEIKTLIGDSVDKVDAGSKLVAEAGSTMNEIVASVRQVTDMMGEIMAASQEQSAGIEQINQAISQMDEVTQQNAALVEEAAAAAASMQEQAGHLAQTVSFFKLDQTQSRTAPVISRPVPRAASAPVRNQLSSPASISACAPSARRLQPAHATNAAEWEAF